MSEAVRGYQMAHPEVDWDTHVVQLRRVGDVEHGAVGHAVNDFPMMCCPLCPCEGTRLMEECPDHVAG